MKTPIEKPVHHTYRIIVTLTLLLFTKVEQVNAYPIYINFQGWWTNDGYTAYIKHSENDWQWTATISLGNNWYYFNMPNNVSGYNIGRGNSTSNIPNDFYVNNNNLGAKIVYKNGDNDASFTTDWTSGWEDTNQKPWIKFNVSDGDKSKSVNEGDLLLGTTNKIFIKEFGAWTWKKNNGNVSKLDLYYRLGVSGSSASGDFSDVYTTVVNTQNTNNGNTYQKWMWTGDNNIMPIDKPSGNYYVQFYFTADVNRATNSATCPEQIYYSNNGNNYYAQFTIPQPVVEAKSGSFKIGQSSTVIVGPKSGTTISGQTLHYKFEKSTDGGSIWNEVQAYSTTNSYTFTLNDPKNERIRVRMKVTDTNEESAFVELPMQYIIYVEDSRDWSNIYLHENQISGGSDYNAVWPGVIMKVAFKNGTTNYYEVILDTWYKRFWLNDGTTTNQTFNAGIPNDWTPTDGTEGHKKQPSNHNSIWYIKTDGDANDCYLSERDISPYRLKSITANGTFYSNILVNSGTMSLYCTNAGTLSLEKLVNGVWTTQGTATITRSGITEDNVYTADFNGTNTVSNFTIYTGDYHLYSDAVGNSLNHKAGNNTAFEYYQSGNEGFTANPYHYYWVDWVRATGENDLVATVGNNINHRISQQIANDTLWNDITRPKIDAARDSVNVRFAYEPKTNYFGRALLKGATQRNEHFLMLYDSDSHTLFRTNVAEGETGDYVAVNTIPSNIPSIGTLWCGTFNDMHNWIYYLDVKANKDSKVIAYSNFFDKGYYLFGTDEEEVDKHKRVQLTGSESEQTVRLIYDFKTGRLVTAWIPDDEITSSINLNASMMILREGNSDAARDLKSITLGEGIEVSNIKQIFTVIEIKESDLTMAGGDMGSFFFSLPYKCKVSDIFGLDGSYLGKWALLRYNGQKRAQQGLYSDTGSFWEIVGINETLQRGEGYVLQVANLTSSQKTNGVQLYFPSLETEIGTLSNSNELTTTLDEMNYTGPTHTGSKNIDHSTSDVNWRLVGMPGYGKMTATFSPALDENQGEEDNQAKYCYVLKEDGDYEVKILIPNSTTFSPTYSYLFQYEGNIRWNNVATTASDKIIARQKTETTKPALLDIQLLRDDKVQDHTYIQVYEQATNGFDMSQDLTKIINNGDNIYTRCYNGDLYVDLAANNLPPTTTEVPLFVKTTTTDEYTFSKGEALNGMNVILYDKQTDCSTDLELNDYSVSLAQGEYNERFVLHISQQTEVITSTENSDVNFVLHQTGDRIFISGFNGEADVLLYDMLGHTIYSGMIHQGEGIPCPAQGLYLICINGHTEHLMIR